MKFRLMRLAARCRPIILAIRIAQWRFGRSVEASERWQRREAAWRRKVMRK
jgi:hypothetical protein